MLNATRDLILPTAITGSYPRPAWFTEGLRGRSFKDALGDSAFREQYFDAAACLMREQERAGLDIVSDGDARFDLTVGGRSWFFYPLERLRGITGHVDRTSAGGWGALKPGHILYEVQEAWQPPILGERVEAGPLDYAALFKVAQRFSERPVKFAPSAPRRWPRCSSIVTTPPSASSSDLADIFNAGTARWRRRAAGSSGGGAATPHLRRGRHRQTPICNSSPTINRGSRAWRRKSGCIPAGVIPTSSRALDPAVHERALPYLLQTNADVISLECASTGGACRSSTVRTDRRS
jgi:5-methyltetrahydropteroyltriglutamate--homocysteine methyltransferase